MGQMNSDFYELRKSVMIFQSREKNTFGAFACWVQFFRDIDYQFEELCKLFLLSKFESVFEKRCHSAGEDCLTHANSPANFS